MRSAVHKCSNFGIYDGTLFDTEALYRDAVMAAATENLVEMPLSLYLSFREGWTDQLYVISRCQGTGVRC
jgi:beta-phosphoglucomutase-like phosphatase (HAD superfamily)